jgi:hypothetical protein
MRLVVLMVAALVIVGAGLTYIVWKQRQSAYLAEQRAAFEARMRCLEAERRLVDFKSGAAVGYGESEATTREFVWICRGRPADLRPKDL